MDIDFDEIEFKTVLTTLDYINSRPKEEKENLISEIRLIAVSLIKPRLTYEEILGLDLPIFNELIQLYSKKFNQKALKNDHSVPIVEKPAGSLNKGFNFIPISNMNPEE